MSVSGSLSFPTVFGVIEKPSSLALVLVLKFKIRGRVLYVTLHEPQMQCPDHVCVIFLGL